MNIKANSVLVSLLFGSTLIASGCSDSKNNSAPQYTEKSFTPYVGSDLNRQSSSFLSLNPGGPGSSPNQSLRAGDVVRGQHQQDDLLVGGLGVDVLLGYSGDDILIGGTEDFNSSVDGDGQGADNRDRAFGHEGDDVFIWAPGDGSDYFNGGDGTDVLILGVLGEQRDANDETEGAPFFNVSPPSQLGSQDFDGIFVDENYRPTVSVSGSPGFCSLIDAVAEADNLEALKLDQIVRFTLRGLANSFDAGEQSNDDGLRVALSTKNVEYLVCAQRVVTENGGENNIEVLDISAATPVVAQLSDLPEYVQGLIQ